MIYRLKPPVERSKRALCSLQGLTWTAVPFVRPESASFRDRKIACSKAHLHCLERFLGTNDSHATILEDDAIFSENSEWLSLTGYDVFLPFAHNRKPIPPNLAIAAVLPQFAMFAYRASRVFAERFAKELASGAITDPCHRIAARGLGIGSYKGNLVQHDNLYFSNISEMRRLRLLAAIRA